MLVAITWAPVDMDQLRALSGYYGANPVRIVRYFVAAEVKTAEGDEKLLVLSPYFLSLAASERRLAEVASQYPTAQILTRDLALDVADWRDTQQRMLEYRQRAYVERRGQVPRLL